MPFASTSHYSLLQALADAGMDSGKDVTLVNLDPDKMPAAWTGGQVAAAWVWDPTLTQLLQKGHAVMSSEDTAKAGKPTFDLEAATTKFIDANQPFMKVWAACQDAAVKQIKDNPNKAAESISAELGISPAEVKKQLPGYTYSHCKRAGKRRLAGRKAGQGPCDHR